MFFLRLIFAFALATAAAQASDVLDQSTTDAGGGRVLSHSIVIDAPVSRVWAAIFDPATIRRWSTPFAETDLRQGGRLEEGFSKDSKAGDPGNIRHEIVGYVPERLAILRNQNSPPMLPGREQFKQILQVVDFDALPDGKTRLTVIHLGYGTGPQWDGLYQFFATHNPEYLDDLKTSLETGVLHAGGAS